jgi:hypothetical protein
MSDLSFSQYQEVLKPFQELIFGIINLIEELPEEKTSEKTKDLLNQIFLSVITMHLSQKMQGKGLPNKEELEEKITNNEEKDVYSEFMKGLTLKTLQKYFEDSTSLIMTNYYFEVKEKMTQEKIDSIQRLYQEIQERS